jgi:hypothetical protein
MSRSSDPDPPWKTGWNRAVSPNAAISPMARSTGSESYVVVTDAAGEANRYPIVVPVLL